MSQIARGQPHGDVARRTRIRSQHDRLRHMLIGYARVSKVDGAQALDLQRDALLFAKPVPDHRPNQAPRG